jgi:hypothetical protein
VPSERVALTRPRGKESHLEHTHAHTFVPFSYGQMLFGDRPPAAPRLVQLLFDASAASCTDCRIQEAVAIGA